MKAITLYQPWATLVAIGEKRIETRSWSTKYRGPLAIHVSKNKKIDDLMCWKEPFASALEGTLVHIGPTKINIFGTDDPYIHYEVLRQNLHLGCVIATCDLVACTQMKFITWLTPNPIEVNYDGKWWSLIGTEKEFGDFSLDRYLWFLANVKLLPEPIPAKGMMGLWEWNNAKAL